MKQFLVILSTFIVVLGFSQKYNIKHYTVQDGLLHSFVNDIIQDSRGNVWIATGGGLCHFNGVKFHSFTTRDGLINTRLTCLEEDNAHNIWIGSSVGLNYFDGDSIYSVSINDVGEEVLALEKSADGSVWVATGEGVLKIHYVGNGKFITNKIMHDFGDAKKTVIFQERTLRTFMLETTSGQLFIGLNNGLFIFGGKDIKKIEIPATLSIYSACELANGNVIFGTNRGLSLFDNMKVVPYFIGGTENLEIVKITRRGSKLWMLGQNAGSTENLQLYSADPNDTLYFRIIGIENGLIDHPTSLFIDHENNIWVSSNGGLSVLKGEIFVNYSETDGLAGNKIWAVHQDRRGRMWVGTIGQGLSVIDNRTIKAYTYDDGLPDGYIGRIFHDRGDTIWLGTGKKGLCYAISPPGGKPVFYCHKGLLPGAGELRVDDIVRDNGDTLWIATSKGLYFTLNSRTFFHTPLFPGDTGQVFVQKIHISHDGSVWVGTKSNGLYIGNAMGFISFFRSDEPLNISSICEDYNDNIWISSQRKGIMNISIDPKKWISEKDGLASDVVYILQPALILDKTRDLVIETFARSNEEVKDGMDIALCAIHRDRKNVQYAGGNSSLYHVHNQELVEIKPDKQYIGKQVKSGPFTNHEIPVQIGDVIYLFSDGYADQFGGPKGRKFLYKPFKKLLLSVHKKPVDEQSEILLSVYEEWKGNYEQVDDICVLGIRL